MFDFVSAYIELTYRNLEIILLENFKDNVTINIMVIKSCINKREKKDLNQLLKNQLKESKEALRIAKGDKIINTFIIIRRIEYENIKEIRPILQNDFSIPVNEKTSKEFPFIEITEFNSVTNVLNEIVLETKLLPTSCNAFVSKSVILINCSQIK